MNKFSLSSKIVVFHLLLWASFIGALKMGEGWIPAASNPGEWPTLISITICIGFLLSVIASALGILLLMFITPFCFRRGDEATIRYSGGPQRWRVPGYLVALFLLILACSVSAWKGSFGTANIFTGISIPLLAYFFIEKIKPLLEESMSTPYVEADGE